MATFMDFCVRAVSVSTLSLLFGLSACFDPKSLLEGRLNMDGGGDDAADVCPPPCACATTCLSTEICYQGACRSRFKEFPLLSRQTPVAITSWENSTLTIWFTEISGRVGRIEPDYTVTEFNAHYIVGVTCQITPGQGEIWVVGGAFGLGRVSMDGIPGPVTIGPTSMLPQTSYGIVRDADDNMWFTEPQAGRVAIITFDGNFAEFSLPAGSFPASIAVGSDGALWFSDPHNGSLGRLSTAGEVAVFQLPAGRNPVALVEGRDGNLWVGATGGVERVSTSGQVTDFALDTSVEVNAIAVGPDGNIWFVRSDGNVWQISEEGNMVPYPLPDGVSIGGMTDGGDGALWFTDMGNHSVWRFDLR
jgi:virginiamycin B lyase